MRIRLAASSITGMWAVPPEIRISPFCPIKGDRELAQAGKAAIVTIITDAIAFDHKLVFIATPPCGRI